MFLLIVQLNFILLWSLYNSF